MPAFPLFVDLKGKKCVVIGGGKVATRKIESLLGFGARIVVVSPGITERIQDLKWQDRVIVLKKRYSEEDLEGAFMAIAATSDRRVNEKIYEDAVRSGIFVNVIDSPEKCTFVFPSLVKRNDLVVGITTSGGYPALSKAVRKKIEEILPESYGRILEILRECRNRAEVQITDPDTRKQLLDRLLDEITFYEDAVTEEQLKTRIENIFGEYRV